MIDLDKLLMALESHGWLGIITVVIVGFIVIIFILWLIKRLWILANGK